MSVSSTSPAPSAAKDANGRRLTPEGARLGLKSEPLDESEWNASFVVKRKDGRTTRRSGRVTADQIRRIAQLHEKRLRSVTAKRASAVPKSEGSPIKKFTRLEGEQKDVKMPTIGLTPGWKGILVRRTFRVLAAILDGFRFFLRDTKLKDKVAVPILIVGIFMLCLVFPLWVWLGVLKMQAYGTRIESLIVMAKMGEIALPPLALFIGLVATSAGISFKMGLSYRALFAKYHDPQRAWGEMPIFVIGGVVKVLKDLYEGHIAFGGIGSGKTASFISPLLLQLLRKLNNPDPNAVDARFGGLLLDVKGNFTDLTIYLMIQVGRPLSDLILIDTDMDLFRYNPLDPYDPRFSQNGAAKMEAVNKVVGNESSSGDNVYWNKTSVAVIRYLLATLEVVRPRTEIGLDVVARYSRDDDRVAALITQARSRLEFKRLNNEISPDGYAEAWSAVSELQSNWHQLDNRTKTILKTTLAAMLGPLASDPKLQRVFCRDTNFSFRDVINDGKIVLFRGRNLDPQASRLIAVCLKRDFQMWIRRRYGVAAVDNGLNTTRTMVFLADEFQEVVTCGGSEGDDGFTAVCRDARCAYIVATQLKASLDVAIKNEAQLNMLLGNLSSKIFFKLSDKGTQELGAFFSGKFLKDRERATVYHSTFAAALAGAVKTQPRDYHSQVDQQWEEVIQAHEFSKLVVRDKSRGMDPPYFSEGIIFNYNELEKEKISWMTRCRFHHLYPSREEMLHASVMFDDLLYARNAQSRVQRRFFLLAAQGRRAREKMALLVSDSAKAVLAQASVSSTPAAGQGGKASTLVETAERHREVLAMLRPQLAEAEKKLEEYRETVGMFGDDFERLNSAVQRLRASVTFEMTFVQTEESSRSSIVASVPKGAAEAILRNCSLDEVLARAKEREIPRQLKAIPGEKAREQGVAHGMVVRGSVPDASHIQESALPAREVPKQAAEGAKPHDSSQNSTPAETSPASSESGSSESPPPADIGESATQPPAATTSVVEGKSAPVAAKSDDALTDPAVRLMMERLERIVETQRNTEFGYARQVREVLGNAPSAAAIAEGYAKRFPDAAGDNQASAQGSEGNARPAEPPSPPAPAADSKPILGAPPSVSIPNGTPPDETATRIETMFNEEDYGS